MQIFRVIAGYSYGKADIVRRAISKKKLDVIEKERINFINGAVSQGASASDAESLFEDMIGFANYGFKKSHAASYGILSYRTAYLKAHYPAEYFSALLSSELGNTAKTVQYINDAERLGIKLLPPDINESEVNFSVSCDGNIRYGLLALKNVGESYVRAIISERKNAAFEGLAEFLIRMKAYDTNRKQVESLIKSGAFDRLGVTRSSMLVAYEEMIDLLSSDKRRNLDGQVDMFASDLTLSCDYTYKEIPELDLRTRLAQEREVSGMYFSGHPLDDYREVFESTGNTLISKVLSCENSQKIGFDKRNVTVSGMITKVERKKSRNGEMAFVSLQDKTGEIEIILFSDLFLTTSEYIIAENPITVTGEVSFKEDEEPKIIAKSVSKIGIKNSNVFQKPQSDSNEKTADAPENKKIYLRVDSMNSSVFKQVDAIINIFSGSARVIVYEKEYDKYSAITNKGCSDDVFVIGELRQLLGDENVIIK